MACEDQCRLAVEPELMEQEMGAGGKLDAALWVGICLVEIPDVVDMGELGADPAEIVPDAGKNPLDFLRRFFRERRGQIGTADPLFAQCGPDQARDTAEQVGGLVRIEIV